MGSSGICRSGPKSIEIPDSGRCPNARQRFNLADPRDGYAHRAGDGHLSETGPVTFQLEREAWHVILVREPLARLVMRHLGERLHLTAPERHEIPAEQHHVRYDAVVPNNTPSRPA